MVKADLKSHIRSVPGFPKKGIVFRDITTLLRDAAAYREALERLQARYREEQVEKVVAIEARGFIFGAALADRLHAGFVPVRKPGKLPAKTRRQNYELEYGTDALEIHADALLANERVLVVDDLLATGGTAAATCQLVEQLGGKIVGLAFLIELTFLHGRDKLKNYDVFSLIRYDAE